jgi:hypothetical protein
VSLEIRPITLRAACAFIAEHHRHNKPPRGHKFSVSVWDGERLIGVATAGRPIARHFDDGLTLEVNRTCTLDGRAPRADGHADGANTMLYGAVWRAARAMGYRRCITYTQADESGASLRGAGYRRVKELEPRAGWAESSVALKGIRDPTGNGGVARVLWEITR